MEQSIFLVTRIQNERRKFGWLVEAEDVKRMYGFDWYAILYRVFKLTDQGIWPYLHLMESVS
jgi:hypothetical protein